MRICADPSAGGSSAADIKLPVNITGFGLEPRTGRACVCVCARALYFTSAANYNSAHADNDGEELTESSAPRGEQEQ